MVSCRFIDSDLLFWYQIFLNVLGYLIEASFLNLAQPRSEMIFFKLDNLVLKSIKDLSSDFLERSVSKFLLELVRFPRKRAVFLILRGSQVKRQAALDEGSELSHLLFRHAAGGNFVWG